MESGFFREQTVGGSPVLVPQPSALSQWGGARPQLRGMATSGALARAVERAARPYAEEGAFRPARWTVDLLRPAAVADCAVTTTVVRKGRRVCVIDAVLTQDSVPVARGSALLLAAPGAAAGAAGAVWNTADRPGPPPPDLRPGPGGTRLLSSDGVRWTASAEDHLNDHRTLLWHLPVRIVEGEESGPFPQVAAIADLASVTSHWGADGLRFINADITVGLARMPVGDGIGLAADRRSEADGIAVGTVALFDRSGVFGTATVAALFNTAGGVDPRNRS